MLLKFKNRGWRWLALALVLVVWAGVGAGVLAQGTDPQVEQGSRGVARHLLLTGIAVAVVIALLSGVFAFRHKKR